MIMLNVINQTHKDKYNMLFSLIREIKDMDVRGGLLGKRKVTPHRAEREDFKGGLNGGCI